MSATADWVSGIAVILPGGALGGWRACWYEPWAGDVVPLTGIDQVGIFIDLAGLFASRLAPTEALHRASQIPQAKMISPTLAHLPHVS
jgi:hypothetical protein